MEFSPPFSTYSHFQSGFHSGIRPHLHLPNGPNRAERRKKGFAGRGIRTPVVQSTKGLATLRLAGLGHPRIAGTECGEGGSHPRMERLMTNAIGEVIRRPIGEPNEPEI